MSRKKIALLMIAPVTILAVVIAVLISIALSTPPTLTASEPLFIDHTGEVSCLEFTSDGKYLIAGSKGIAHRPDQYWEGGIMIIDLAARKEFKFLWQEQWVDSISLSPDGNKLAVALSNFDLGRNGYIGFEPKGGIVHVGRWFLLLLVIDDDEVESIFEGFESGNQRGHS